MVALGAPPVNPSWYSNTAATFTLELEFYLFEQGKKAVVAAEAKAVRPAALVSPPSFAFFQKTLFFPPPSLASPSTTLLRFLSHPPSLSSQASAREPRVRRNPGFIRAFASLPPLVPAKNPQEKGKKKPKNVNPTNQLPPLTFSTNKQRSFIEFT